MQTHDSYVDRERDRQQEHSQRRQEECSLCHSSEYLVSIITIISFISSKLYCILCWTSSTWCGRHSGSLYDRSQCCWSALQENDQWFLRRRNCWKKNKIQATIGEDVAVEGFVDPDPDPDSDPDPLQNPPLFSFKSTYSPSGIVSIWGKMEDITFHTLAMKKYKESTWQNYQRMSGRFSDVKETIKKLFPSQNVVFLLTSTSMVPESEVTLKV